MMKISLSILAGCIVLLICGCKHRNTVIKTINDVQKHIKASHNIKTDTSDSTVRDTSTNLKLKYGFRLIDWHWEQREYNSFELWHNNKKIFSDTINEFVFEDKKYPLLNKLDDDTFELLIEYDDRPNKNKLILFRIKNNSIIKKDTLATFTNKTEKINGTLIYSGPWDNSEEWDEHGKRYISFDPVLYYRSTPDGIKLDSVLTISENKKSYGNNINAFEKEYELGFPIDKNNNIDTLAGDVLRKKP